MEPFAPTPAPHGRDDFATTQWSLVLKAGQGEGAADESLQRLCQTYWLPIYAYVRRRSRDASEAQDLTQEFFARLLEKNLFAAASPERGRFRAFLLTSLKHFLINEHQRAVAQKRGGGRALLTLDWEAGERRWRHEPADGRDPERLFERQWALALLDQTLARLAEEWRAGGKAEAFEHLRPLLVAENAAESYAELAPRLGMSAGAVRQAVSRLRKRYRALLREEVAATLDEGEEIDEELGRLFAALA
jgi:RNA polymerase sigma factor (sigma-70 family)